MVRLPLSQAAASWCAARAARLRLPGLAARLFAEQVAELRPASAAPGLNVLCFTRAALVEDLLSSFADTPEVRLLGGSREVLKGIGRAFLPEPVGDNFYVSDDPALTAGKSAYRDFLRRMWPQVRDALGIDLVVASNFAHWAQRELHTVCEETGTPFVVLFKESLKPPGLVDFYGWLYEHRRGPFTGRRMLVYNEIERQMQLDRSITTADRLAITGMPRLDRLHAWRRAQAGQPRTSGPPTVLFFHFNASTGLPFTPLDTDIVYGKDGADPALLQLSYAETAARTAETMVRLARENPDIRVVVKGKPGHAKPGQMASPLLSPDLPPNLVAINWGDPFELICKADVICGFNSTALMEGLAAGKPVVVPHFAEAAAPDMAPYLVDLGAAAQRAESPERLGETLLRIATNPPPLPAELDGATLQALEAWTGNTDGGAGARVAAALLAEIDRQGGRRAA